MLPKVAELGRGRVALADTELVEVSAVRKSPMVASMLRQAQPPQAQPPKNPMGKARLLSLWWLSLGEARSVSEH